MARKKVENMTDEELMDAWTQEGATVEAGKERLREFSKEHQKRERLAQLNLQPGDLDLLQSASAAGIESEEAVN